MEYRIKYSDAYLEHHGIKGQKWGVRRYQNPDGTLTPAGKGRKYNYKESDSYKNGTLGERRKQSSNYNYNKATMGETSANRIQYDINEKGYSNSKARQREKNRIRATSAALIIGTVAFRAAMISGSAWYHNQKVYVQANNIGVQEYARRAGIPIDNEHIGIGLGFKEAARGKKFYDKYYAYK